MYTDKPQTVPTTPRQDLLFLWSNNSVDVCLVSSKSNQLGDQYFDHLLALTLTLLSPTGCTTSANPLHSVAPGREQRILCFSCCTVWQSAGLWPVGLVHVVAFSMLPRQNPKGVRVKVPSLWLCGVPSHQNQFWQLEQLQYNKCLNGDTSLCNAELLNVQNENPSYFYYVQTLIGFTWGDTKKHQQLGSLFMGSTM